MEEQPKSEVELHFSCRKLKDMDFVGKSDPYVRVSVKTKKDLQYRKIGETEILKENLNPDFTTGIKAEYLFELHQDVKIEVYDDDGKKDDLIGVCYTNMGTLVGSKNQTFSADLHKE
jgi:Ca2+-dependent lipid-binding protein